MRHIVVASFLVVTACASTQTVKEDTSEKDYIEAHRRAAQRMMENFERVNFAFDSSALDEMARAALAENVEIMRDYPLLNLEIEGHCDDAGTIEYNIALGHRRAESIRKYMNTAGVGRARLETISYGEERPISWSGTDASQAANRRAEFRITFGASPHVRGTVQDVYASR